MPGAAVILVTLSSLVGAIVTFFLEYISRSQYPKNKMESNCDHEDGGSGKQSEGV